MIDIDKFVLSLLEYTKDNGEEVAHDFLCSALEDQGLHYNNIEIVPVEESLINPSEFDKRLNTLLKEFESLPKEDLIDSLEFYLKVVKGEMGTEEDFKTIHSSRVLIDPDLHKVDSVKATGVLAEMLKDVSQEELEETRKEMMELTEFEKAFDRLAFNYMQEPDGTNEGTVRDCKKYAKELLSIAKKQFIDEACGAYCYVCGHYAHDVPTLICRHDCIYFSKFRKYMEEQQ